MRLQNSGSFTKWLRNSDSFPGSAQTEALAGAGASRKPSEAGLGYSHGVVIWFPAFQLLEAEETLGQVGLVLSGAVDKARRGHLQGRTRLRPRRGRVTRAHSGAGAPREGPPRVPGAHRGLAKGGGRGWGWASRPGAPGGRAVSPVPGCKRSPPGKASS